MAIAFQIQADAMNFRQLMTFCLLAVFLGSGSVHAAVAAKTESPVPKVTVDDVQKLIMKLGAEEFAVRERAQLELSKLGFIAFESLEEVRDHDDFEIRVRVRRLLDVLRGPLMMAPGTASLDSLLVGYTSLNEEKRAEKIAEIGQYDLKDALPVLTRFARFEDSLDLAKIAAITAMQMDFPTHAAERAKLVPHIADNCGLSKRTSIDWLRAFAASLNEPEKHLTVWKDIQAAAVGDGLPAEVLRGISQVHMDVLARAGEKEAAFELAERIVGMGVEGRQDVANVADWILKRDLVDLFDRFYEANREEFEADRALLYRLAESQAKHGDRETAEKTAKRAFEIVPDERCIATRYWIWQTFQTRDSIHTTTANNLRDRGFFAWAEREYRKSIELKMQPHYVYIKSHVWLAEMLHDQQEDLRAGQVLDGLMGVVKEDAKVKNAFENTDQPVGAARARMQFFFAAHHKMRGDMKKEMQSLSEGIEASPFDADVLIAMHRVEDAPDEWREKTRAYIQRADKHATDAIRKARQDWERSHGRGEVREVAQRRLAQKLNDYAWLVGNTIGDAQQAVRSSHESLELEPSTPGYLDTLGRCYYRTGDYENAIRYQEQAVRRDPHSGQLVRQLNLFRSALEKKKSGDQE